jgi:hypothetical protein
MLPAIPQATDLASALLAISALTAVVNQITNNGPGSSGGGSAGGSSKPPGIGTYKQFTRTTEKVKVTNPNDPSQFVEIERIKSLVMKDIKTGEAWTWNR